MKKTLFIAAVACATGIYACKKEHTTTIKNTVRDTTIINSYATGMVDPDTLTAGLRVAHGTLITGEFPTASTDGERPELDSFYFKTHQVVESRYLAIYPPVNKGYIAGYYVQVVGAKSYFNVDYSKAYNLKQTSIVAGNYDSTIVFKLPVDIKGDTFFVKYAAYDAQGRVGNALTARVLILPQGSAAFTDSLTGHWNYASKRSYDKGVWSSEDFVQDTLSGTFKNYSCNGSTLNEDKDNGDLHIADIRYTRNKMYSISRYAFAYSERKINEELDLDNATCSNYVYRKTVLAADDPATGGYSYDPVSRKITFIYEDEITPQNTPNITLKYSTYYLTELTSTYMILSERVNSGIDNNGAIHYYKYIKQ